LSFVQDLEYDAAVPMYIMRQYMVEFLHSRVYSKGHKNILEDFLYQALCTTEYIAMIRANAIIDLLVARPMRWMAGKSADMTDWSPFSMGPVLDTVEQLFERGAHDGSALLDANLFDRKHQSYLFKSVADSQPAFCEYLDHVYTEDTVQSPDKNKKYLQYTEALKELLNPTDETNAKTRALTIKYLQVQCAAGITKMHDTRTVLPEYLTSQDGAKCWDKVAQGHVDTLGTEATNDKFSESVFGVFDRMLKLFHGISREAASGLAQADPIRSHQISYHQISSDPIRSHQFPFPSHCRRSAQRASGWVMSCCGASRKSHQRSRQHLATSTSSLFRSRRRWSSMRARLSESSGGLIAHTTQR
jgi:hypothetical protein